MSNSVSLIVITLTGNLFLFPNIKAEASAPGAGISSILMTLPAKSTISPLTTPFKITISELTGSPFCAIIEPAL